MGPPGSVARWVLSPFASSRRDRSDIDRRSDERFLDCSSTDKASPRPLRLCGVGYVSVKWWCANWLLFVVHATTLDAQFSIRALEREGGANWLLVGFANQIGHRNAKTLSDAQQIKG